MQHIRNIIVTGSNKGIGFGIVKHLASKQGWNIIMAVRNTELGEKSRDQILKEYPNAKLHLQKLDVSNSKSIDEFLAVVKDKYKNIDVLVNNAGVAAKGDAFDSEVIKFTFQTNFYGTIEISEKILPLLTEKGKIVTLGSSAGKMAFNKISKELQERFRNPNLTKEELFALVKQFEDRVADNTYLQKGWPKWSYGVSKLALNIYINILSKQKEVLDRNIQVYVCCPGFVKTDMSSHKGHLTVQEGIQTPVYLIDLPFELNKELQGGFFERQKLSSTFA